MEKLTEGTQDLLNILKNIDEVKRNTGLTSKDIATILNSKYEIKDDSPISYTTIGQYKNIEKMLDELETNKLISKIGDTIFIK